MESTKTSQGRLRGGGHGGLAPRRLRALSRGARSGGVTEVASLWRRSMEGRWKVNEELR